jgi:DNA-binding NarL/FixJ family response regulator
MPGLSRRVLVVEDEQLVSALLEQTLQSVDFVTSRAQNAVEAKRQIGIFDPDIALLDIDLGPGANGIDVAHILAKQHPDIAILFLTKFPDLRSAGLKLEDLPPGCGFLRKELVGNTEYLVNAIDSVLGERPKVRDDLRPDRPLSALPKNQIEALRLLASGYTNAEIARRRDTSVSSVEQLLNTTFKNLGIQATDDINPRIEAVRIFIQAAGIPNREN